MLNKPLATLTLTLALPFAAGCLNFKNPVSAQQNFNQGQSISQEDFSKKLFYRDLSLLYPNMETNFLSPVDPDRLGDKFNSSTNLLPMPEKIDKPFVSEIYLKPPRDGPQGGFGL
jgi:hypothetical protein